MAAVRADLSKRLVPDELWELVAPLLPLCAARPQGGGTAPRDERTVFTAVAYILTSGCAWRYLPESFGVSPATAHRRFSVWTEAGLWRRLHRAAAGSSGRAADAFLALKASTHSPAAQATSETPHASSAARGPGRIRPGTARSRRRSQAGSRARPRGRPRPPARRVPPRVGRPRCPSRAPRAARRRSSGCSGTRSRRARPPPAERHAAAGCAPGGPSRPTGRDRGGR